MIIVKGHAEHQHIRLGSANNLFCFQQRTAVKGVVRINKEQILPPCFRDSAVAGRRNAAVFLMNTPDLGTGCGELVANRAGTIRGAVVDQEDFIVLQTGACDCMNRICKRILTIVNRYDNAEIHIFHRVVVFLGAVIAGNRIGTD